MNNLSQKKEIADLMKEGTVSPNLFNSGCLILSDNSKDLVTKIIIKSDDKVINSSIDFTELAKKLQAIYSKGNKSSTTYSGVLVPLIHAVGFFVLDTLINLKYDRYKC